MKRFLAVCSLLIVASSALALDREAFTLTQYDLQIRLEPEQSRLGARGTITIRNDTAQPQRVAVLQISSSLDWRAVKVDGKPVQFVSQPLTSDIDHTGALSEAIVSLPAEIRPRDSVIVEIAYEGVIPLDGTRLTQIGVPEEIAAHASWDQISPAFTAVRGVGYVTWYPVATEAADFSEGNSMFQVVDRWKQRESQAVMKIDVCSSEPAAAHAVLMGDRLTGVRGGPSGATNGEQPTCVTHVFDSLGVVAPAFVLGKFQTQTKDPVSVHYLAGHEAGAGKYLDAVDAASKFVGDWFGKPWARVTFADLADSKAAPFESGTLLLTPMTMVDAKLAQINVTHELVHAAFSSPRPWLQEGLAHFAEAAYRESQDGRHAALLLLGIHRAALLEPEKEVSAGGKNNRGEPLIDSFDEIYYRSKAAYVWWMLRDMMGEAALKGVLRQYRAEEDKDPKYVEHLISTGSKRDLGWFFDDWVNNDRGLPDFHVQAVHPWKNEKGVQIVTVTIDNLGGAGAEVPFTVRFDGGEITRRLEVRAKASATTRLEIPGVPTEVTVNDGSVPESDMTNNVFRVTGP